jgi:hypothetical protein
MGKRKSTKKVAWKPKSEATQIFENAAGKFPKCTGTYPDECPEEVNVTKQPCASCPIFIESPNKKRYVAQLKAKMAKGTQ